MSKAPSEGQARTLIASFAVDTPWAEIEADVQPFVELTPRERGDRFAAFLRAECNIEAPPAKPVEPVVKFGLLADLGIIVVPEDYKLVTEFAGMDFSNPTRVLKPGDRLWVRAHKQTVGGMTTSEERLAFLRTSSVPRGSRSSTRSVASCRMGTGTPRLTRRSVSRSTPGPPACREWIGASSTASTATSATSRARGSTTAPSSRSATSPRALSRLARRLSFGSLTLPSNFWRGGRVGTYR